MNENKTSEVCHVCNRDTHAGKPIADILVKLEFKGAVAYACPNCLSQGFLMGDMIDGVLELRSNETL